MTKQSVQPIIIDVLFQGPIEQAVCDSSDIKTCNYFQRQLSTRLPHFEKDDFLVILLCFPCPVSLVTPVLDSDDICPGFQSQGEHRACLFRHLYAIEFSDSPPVQHLLTSWQQGWWSRRFDTRT